MSVREVLGEFIARFSYHRGRQGVQYRTASPSASERTACDKTTRTCESREGRIASSRGNRQERSILKRKEKKKTKIMTIQNTIANEKFKSKVGLLRMDLLRAFGRRGVLMNSCEVFALPATLRSIVSPRYTIVVGGCWGERGRMEW